MPDDIQQHYSGSDAKQHVLQCVEEAVASGEWMVGVWKVEGGRLEMLTLTRHKFPDEDSPTAVHQMQEALPHYEKVLQRQNKTR
jgi:hypothetical protein